MQVLGIDRVLIATPAIEASVETFEELLGLSFGERIDPDGEPVTNRTSAVGVEFVTGDPGSPVAEFIEENGPGLYALALEVADLDVARRHLAAADVEPVAEMGAGSLRELFYHPSAFAGTLLVLTEYDHRHPAELAAREELDDPA